ncbi:MAG: hypothetical protein H7Z12_02020 [Rhodospirillaceae bacterium]|nr:hypothetical protein [Rhodospirillales bacterium]
MAEQSVSYTELVAVIGEAKALELSKQRGGRTVYVPSAARLGVNTPLVELLGVNAAEAMATFGIGGQFRPQPLVLHRLHVLQVCSSRVQQCGSRPVHSGAEALAITGFGLAQRPSQMYYSV